MVVVDIGVVHCRQDNIQFYEDNTFLDTGSLIIAENCVLWEGNTKQFSLCYPQITLHAISRAESEACGETNSNFPQSHLLIMVDGDRAWDNSENKRENGNGMSNGDDDGEDSDRASDCSGTTSLLRFVPSDSLTLENMYKAVADCQALNPDPEDLDDSDLDYLEEEEEYEDECDGQGQCENSNDCMDTDQFADA